MGRSELTIEMGSEPGKYSHRMIGLGKPAGTGRQPLRMQEGDHLDMKMRGLRLLTTLALSLMLAGASLAQNAPAKKTLVVNGNVEGAVVQIEGRSYVDLETLARITDAAVSFAPGRVILTVPAAEAGATRTTAGLSKDFARAGISQLAEMWEWKAAIAASIRYGIAAGTWLGPLLHDHRVRAEGSLSQTSLAAKTESDQKALQLLQAELNYLREWDSQTQATIHSLEGEKAVNPPAAQNDPLLVKISECGNFLDGMLVGGKFEDSPSCH
jgi:hypothetical protein